MTVADHLLPVWTVRPNWIDPVIERLEWLTDVRAAVTAEEQAEALRLSPRRSFEARFTPTEQERAFLSLWLHRLLANECMLPLWHDAATLSVPAAIGDGLLEVDTVDREFLDDGMALLVSPDAFSCEAVRIDTVSASDLSLVVPVGGNWPAGTTIHPMRRATIEDNPQVAGLTSHVGSANIRFIVSDDTAIDAGDETLPVVAGLPLLDRSPNWSRSLDVDHIWLRAAADFDIGRRATMDNAGRGFITQQHNWLFSNRADLWSFRQLLYRLAGRRGRLWLPTFMQDMVLAAPATAGGNVIDIRAIGADYTDVPSPGRDHVLVAGDTILAISSLASPPATGVERLNLASPLLVDLDSGVIVRFVDVARLDQDAIEIAHHASSDGAATVAASFRTTPNLRDGTAPGSLPIPDAEMVNIPCSDDPGAENDWVWEFFYEVTRGTYGYYDGVDYPNPALFLYPVDESNIPGGVLDVTGQDCFPTTLTSEGNEDINFCLAYVDLPHIGDSLTPGSNVVSHCILGPDDPGPFEPESGEPSKFARGRIRFWFPKPEPRRWAMEVQFPAGSGANERSAKIRFYWRMRTDDGENFIREDTVVSLFPTMHVFTM